MTDLLQTIATRYSCRNYSVQEPTDEQLTALLEAARLAPSACNRQPWRFMVVRQGHAAAQAIAQSNPKPMMSQAPAFIVAFGVEDEAWVRPADGHNHVDIDVAIAVEHICLAATALGLGTCWVCNFDPAKLAADLKTDPCLRPIAIIPVGYPAEPGDMPQKKRKSLDEIIIKQ